MYNIDFATTSTSKFTTDENYKYNLKLTDMPLITIRMTIKTTTMLMMTMSIHDVDKDDDNNYYNDHDNNVFVTMSIIENGMCCRRAVICSGIRA